MTLRRARIRLGSEDKIQRTPASAVSISTVKEKKPRGLLQSFSSGDDASRLSFGCGCGVSVERRLERYFTFSGCDGIGSNHESRRFTGHRASELRSVDFERLGNSFDGSR